MTFKDLIASNLLSAQLLIKMGHLYSANILLCSAWELLSNSNAHSKGKVISEMVRMIENDTPEELKLAAIESLSKETGLPIEEVEIKMGKLTKNIAKKFGSPDWKSFNTEFADNWKAYNKTKHGKEKARKGQFKLDESIDIELTLEKVTLLELKLRVIFVTLHKDYVLNEMKI